MKEILIIRHAKSDQTLWHTGISDVNRPLNARGKSDAANMRKVLIRQGWHADAVFCSKAQRTRETLELLKDNHWLNLNQIYFEHNLYTFDAEEVLDFIRNIDDAYQRVAIIGHNPALTYVVENLGQYPLLNLPTAGMVLIGLETDHWANAIQKKGAVLWKAYPSEFR